MKKFAKDIVPNVDRLVIVDEDGKKSAVLVTAVTKLSETRYALSTVGAGMVQVEADVEVRVQSPL